MNSQKLNPAFYDEKGRLLPELRRFNWGAFLLSWIWGIGNGTPITLISLVLGFIPVVKILNLPLCIWFGVRGNEWTLKNKYWESVEYFLRVQRAWAICGVIVFLIIAIIQFPKYEKIMELFQNLQINRKSELKLNHELSHTMLNKFIETEIKANKNPDMSSGEAIAKSFAQNIKTKNQGNSLTVETNEEYDDMIYVFECSNNTSCVVTIDINGNKGPNKITQDANNLKDKAVYKIIKNENDKYEIIKPEWWDEMEKLEY